MSNDAQRTDAFAAGLQLLVIDDDINQRLLARATFEPVGVVVHEAADGIAALDLLSAVTPDVILLDVMMPGLDGYEVCRRLREESRFATVPILMMTGLEDLDSINEAYGCGATDFVTKPVNWELLKHRVRYTIRASTAMRGLASAQRIAHLGNWEWTTDTDRVIASGEALRLMGISRDEGLVTAARFFGQIDATDREAASSARRAAVDHGTDYEISYRILRRDGRTRILHEQGVVVPIRPRSGPRIIGTVQDITQRREFEDQIAFLAMHDPLTRLPNRRYFHEQLERSVAAASRHDRRLGLLYVDLDRFKRVNDLYGHETGDAALREVANRMRRAVRATDTLSRGIETEHEVCRLGGDEFSVLLTDIREAEDPARVAARISQVVAKPIRIGKTRIQLTPSIGIAVYPEDGRTAGNLINSADTAMYHAKEQGPNTYRFFTSGMQRRAQERLELESHLAGAIANDELRLEYQPIFDLRSLSLIGAEALLRWDSAALGPVAPDQFIQVAEESGLILSIGDWVLTEACRQARVWLDAAGPTVRVSINASAAQFARHGFPDRVAAVLQEYGLDSRTLGIELTESVLMGDARASDRTLAALQELGLEIAIDDFGTGYSSLSYLQRFRPHSLKIDGSFIREVDRDPDSQSIVSAILAMARNLDLKVVAEGVERQSQLQFLLEKGCDAVQGYLLARPQSAEDLGLMWTNAQSARWRAG